MKSRDEFDREFEDTWKKAGFITGLIGTFIVVFYIVILAAAVTGIYLAIKNWG